MKTHIKKLHIGSCFLLMCSMAERLQNDFPVLFGVFRFEVFLHDQFFEAVMRAYVACKDEAKVKFGRKNK